MQREGAEFDTAKSASVPSGFAGRDGEYRRLSAPCGHCAGGREFFGIKGDGRTRGLLAITGIAHRMLLKRGQFELVDDENTVAQVIEQSFGMDHGLIQ